MQGLLAGRAAVGSSFDSGHVCFSSSGLDFAAIRARATRSVRTHSIPLVRDHSLQLLLIGLVGHDTLAQLPLPLLGLRGQDMARKRMAADHQARASLLEALGGALVGF